MRALVELIPEAKLLTRGEKLQLIQVLAADLAGDDVAAEVKSDASYAIWSRDSAFQAADVMLRALADDDKGRA